VSPVSTVLAAQTPCCRRRRVSPFCSSWVVGPAWRSFFVRSPPSPTEPTRPRPPPQRADPRPVAPLFRFQAPRHVPIIPLPQITFVRTAPLDLNYE